MIELFLEVDYMDEEKINKKLKPIIEKLMNLYDEIELMVKDGIITREQADDMTGASIDKLDFDDKEKKR